MPIVFDIETVGTPYDQLPPSVREYLVRGAKSPEEAQEMRRRTALQPYTGEVACVALHNTGDHQGEEKGREKGMVLFRSPADRQDPQAEGPVTYRPVPDERNLLEQFWSLVARHRQFVTFNGRRFDIPYLVVRSGIREVKVSKDLLGNRYRSDVHVDLYDQLAFQGAADRHFNLDMVCHAFGIQSPKSEEAHGHKVQEMWEQGRGRDIATYCYGDVLATVNLFRRWKEFMQL